MSRPTRTLAALTGAAALTVTGTSPASAVLWEHEDAVGDVVSYTWTADNKGNETQSGPNPAPANADTDISTFSANHTARRVTFKTSLRDITAASGAMVYQIRTGTRGFWAVQRLGTNREMAPAFLLMRGDRTVRCSDVRRSVDRTTEQVTLSIPRGCLGRPSWVRVGAATDKGQGGETGTGYSYTAFVDDGLTDAPAATERLTLSPRIHRG